MCLVSSEYKTRFVGYEGLGKTLLGLRQTLQIIEKSSGALSYEL